LTGAEAARLAVKRVFLSKFMVILPI
jgi:hypothetical protein